MGLEELKDRNHIIQDNFRFLTDELISGRVKIKPQIGLAIYWKNTKNKEPDFNTLHQSLKVNFENKYLITKGISCRY